MINLGCKGWYCLASLVGRLVAVSGMDEQPKDVGRGKREREREKKDAMEFVFAR